MYGMLFRLRIATIAVQHSAVDKPTLTQLPEGAEVLVVEHVPITPTELPDRQINVMCNGGMYSVFLLDIRERGEAIPQTH